MLTDMWKYIVATRTWVLINGNTTSTPASYSGDLYHLPLFINVILITLLTLDRHPGGRRDGTAWVGPNGSLWLLGGFIQNIYGNEGYYQYY